MRERPLSSQSGHALASARFARLELDDTEPIVILVGASDLYGGQGHGVCLSQETYPKLRFPIFARADSPRV